MTISAFCTYDTTLPSFFISKSRFDQEQCFITQNPDGCDNRTLCSSHEITVFLHAATFRHLPIKIEDNCFLKHKVRINAEQGEITHTMKRK